MSSVAQAKIGAAALIRAARKRKRRSANGGRGLNADQAWIDDQTLLPQSPDKTAFSRTHSGTVGHKDLRAFFLGDRASSSCSRSAYRVHFSNQPKSNLKRPKHVCDGDDYA
jgi:hypothetical protein